MRLGCWLVSLAVLASLVLEPPKAKAFAMTSSAISALAGGYLSACGLTPVVSGMGNSQDVNEAVARLIQDFLDEEHPGVKNAVDWIGDAVLTLNGHGRIMIPSVTAKKLAPFAAWVASKYGTKAGVNQVYGVSGDYVLLADGTKFYLCTNHDDSARKFLNIGTSIGQTDFPITFSTGAYMCLSTHTDGKDIVVFYNSAGERIKAAYANFQYSSRWPIYAGIRGSTIYFVEPTLSTHSLFVTLDVTSFDIGAVTTVDESLSLDVSDTIQQVLDRLTAIEEGQSIALDVGAAQSMEIQEILQGILDAILAGDLAASAEIVDEAVEPVDPEEPDPPVVPVVPEGLDRLGTALTSRFPFSIPWDVYKGVKLLAAPAKTPYFEVDFFAPIGHLVGGWKGSTKIVLDFADYEIIGQVCRWTSTIGFCLMLASGTKRLIWTA